MAAIADADVSIDASGNIRWTGAATTNRHTVLEFIQFLQDKQDDEQAAGDILLDITVDTPFERSTDQILTLNAPFNIDDTFALHLYDGSVSQTNPTLGGEDLWSGLQVIGPVETGTEYIIKQDGKILPAFWGTGINPEAAPSLVFSRHLVKSVEGGAEIDGKRITVLARELGDQYRRFPVTLGTANSVAAISNGADIFNATSDATLATYDTIVNTEGFQELNIDGTGAAGQEFYSQWAIGTQTVNDVYERTKWITQRSHIVDNNAETGNDFIIDDNNTTTQGRGTEFSASADGEILTKAKVRIKIGLGTPTGSVYAELWDSDDVATAAPTGSALARSEEIIATHFTSSYEDTIFQFNRINPATGASQLSGLTLVANQEYFIVIRHADGSATDYFHVEGDTTSADDGNVANDVSGTWTGTASQALHFDVHTSPEIHTIPGESFEGITTEVGYLGETGAGVVENEIAIWGTNIVYDTLVGTFQEGEYVIFDNVTTQVSAGKILFDDGVNMVVALENPGAAVIADGYTITGLTSGATADINVTIEDEDLGGGEGLILAKDDNGVTGEIYIQVISGVTPVLNNRIRSATSPLANYVDATAVINNRTLNPEFIGTSTGSNIIGTYGIGFVPGDVASNDRFTSLDATSRIPPNNVIFTVSGVVSGEDRVLVGPRTGTNLDRGQWLLATALTGATETAVVVKTGTDTVPWAANTINWPATGLVAEPSKIRIQLDTGIYRHVDYASHDSIDTFTIASTDFSGANQAGINQNVFMAFIDVLADASIETFTGVHGGVNRDLFVRVRDGGATPIKTFESTAAQFLSTAQTIAAIRTADA
jgi:hypothetical protein